MTRWILVALFWVTTWVSAKPADIDTFSRFDQFQAVKIAPDGQHLAVLTPMDGKNVLAILSIDTMKPTHVIRFGENKQVGEFYWANNERVIVQLQFFKGWFEQPLTAGEWFAVNVDGKRAKNIYGYRAGGMQTGSRINQATATYGYAQLIDLWKDNEDEILISSTPFDAAGDNKAQLYRLNVYTGKMRKVGRSPVANATFLADHQGRARFVVGTTAKGINQVHYRGLKDDKWQLIYENANTALEIVPLAFADDTHVYMEAYGDGDIAGVFKVNMETQERELVYRDKVVEPNDYYYSADGRHLYALEVSAGRPEYVLVDKARPEAALLKGLLQAFGGSQVKIASQTEDGSKAVVYVFDDRDPGSFYLYDSKANSVSFLMKSRPWVDPAQSAEVRPIEFQARDGMTIRGYLTLPQGVEAKNLPLIVNPHGGPHGERDWWGYNSETQLLASRGMAVLQVNFRGSGGYGGNFEHAGYRQWGAAIQHDIIDATRYVIDQGYADKERVCIYGASFGGYSALQSAILEPDMFACSVGFVGVYDLALMYKEGDIQDHDYGLRYLDKVLGRDEAELKAYSPVHHVDKLKAPVLLIHGKEDERAAIEHADRLAAALKAKDHPFEYIVMKKEAHGFYNEENRTEMYETLLGFFETHLKL
ncbi:alpha/beta hydrolase family protein [Ferrimonas balearica]|uniref:alpha/beta hydrolase family protein n=1 Tax=Ferrimonas balearica TaxID=44012 RepID=UPI001C99C717|nr:S9 family peptidase [Ferrimonas balearica]MBY5992684.1 S9 family peptidase [Ferrimonas balearica]